MTIISKPKELDPTDPFLHDRFDRKTEIVNLTQLLRMSTEERLKQHIERSEIFTVSWRLD